MNKWKAIASNFCPVVLTAYRIVLTADEQCAMTEQEAA